MDLQSLINGRIGIGIALIIGSVIPRRIGYKLAELIADRLSAQTQSPMITSARLNQWMVTGQQLAGEELTLAVNHAVRTTAHCQFDLYHNIRQPENLIRMINLTPYCQQVIDNLLNKKEPMLVVGLHLSNLDIAFMALGTLGIKVFGISVPNPGGGYQWQNEIRNRFGFELMPGSREAIRIAMKRFQQGSTLVLGADRPITGSKYKPSFFGHPSSLPVLHVSLALKLDTPLYLSHCTLQEDGKYLLDMSEPIYMERKPDRFSEIMVNAENILEAAEHVISQVPEQWAMYYPVWPDLAEQVPR
jgi:KDO2-lipid IV(A) lauroyltransferase